MQKNPEIVHPHKIRVNQKITLPAITYESAVLKFPGGVYRIWLGKFLSPEEAESLKEDPVLKGGEIEVIPQKFPRVLLGTGSCGASFTP